MYAVPFKLFKVRVQRRTKSYLLRSHIAELHSIDGRDKTILQRLLETITMDANNDGDDENELSKLESEIQQLRVEISVVCSILKPTMIPMPTMMHGKKMRVA
jgi:hypothetical protein